MQCSKCEEPATKFVAVHNGDPPTDPTKRDTRGVKIIRFCNGHWAEIEQLMVSA